MLKQDQEQIYSAILLVLANKQPKSEMNTIFNDKEYKETLKSLLEENTKLEEMDQDDFVCLLANFIESIMKKNIKNYVNLVIKLGFFEEKFDEKIPSINLELTTNLIKKIYPIQNKSEDDPISIARNILNGIYNRDDRIYVAKQTREFKLDYINWEDRDNLIDIVKLTFFKSLHTFKNEANLEMAEEGNIFTERSTKMSSYKVFSCGHMENIYNERGNLLKKRLKPTMTMEELTKLAPAHPVIKDKLSIPKKEDFDVRNDSKDSLADYKKCFKGNTKNIG